MSGHPSPVPRASGLDRGRPPKLVAAGSTASPEKCAFGDAPAQAGARMRSPPGTWRLFAPALLVWVVAALAIGHPGSGRVVALLAGGAGVLLLVLSGTRPGLPQAGRGTLARLRQFGRAGLSYGAVFCAALVLLGAAVEAGERARADPHLAAAADDGSAVDLEVVLRGFPHTRSSDGADGADGADRAGGSGAAGYAGPEGAEGAAGSAGPAAGAGPGSFSGWVAAGVRVPGGEAPVVLWLQGAAPGGEQWAPGARLVVRGVPVSLGPSSAAAYGVRVSEASPAAGVPGPARVVEMAGRAAAELRCGLREAAETVPGAALVPGLAVGDTTLVDESLELRMQHTSLTHLVAVSGDLVDSGGE